MQLHTLARSEYLSIENNPAYKNKFHDQFVPHRRVFKAEDLFLTCLLENYSNHLDLADGHIAECLKCCEESPDVSFLSADTLYITNKLIKARIRSRISGAIG